MTSWMLVDVLYGQAPQDVHAFQGREACELSRLVVFEPTKISTTTYRCERRG